MTDKTYKRRRKIRRQRGKTRCGERLYILLAETRILMALTVTRQQTPILLKEII
jgi:hypothetical protein